MNNIYLPKSFIKAMETLAEATQSYQEAVEALKQNKELFASFEDPLISKFGVMDCALKRGFFNGSLTKTISTLLEPYHELASIKATTETLGSTFKGMLRPNIYASASVVATTTAKLSKPLVFYDTMQSTLEQLAQATQSVNTAWLNNRNAWCVEKDVLVNLNIDNVLGLSTAFSHLCTLEYETSLLTSIPKVFTSAATQIASIAEALYRELPIGWKYDDLLSTSKCIDDYCKFAIRQHELLQKTTDSNEISWRLEVLDVTSKLVDRQIGWHLSFADAIANEETIDSEENVQEFEPASTTLSLIPTHIGYTRRINKTPTNGLKESTIVKITEKGKQIVDNVLTINKLRLDAGEDRIFGLSETVVGGMLNLSTSVCSTEEQLGRVIDVLYFIFYENLKHIKTLVGRGDENNGDKMVREEDIYRCIFDIKTIRSDLRHDLDHGKPNEVKKKLKNVGDCYKEYCGNRPIKPRDFKKLQERVYDKVIELEEMLIQIMLSKERI